MGESIDWTCPHCGTHGTLQNHNYQNGHKYVVVETALDEEGIDIEWNAVKCPSTKCGKFTLDISAHFGTVQNRNAYGKYVYHEQKNPVGLGAIRFLPRIQIPLSEHVPASVRSDYEEACMIKDLSPKAAATLCRRALQGMIRDFWNVSDRTLQIELKLIEPKCDVDLYQAMMSLKSIGNIGAHPAQDINVIIDVEEGEVDSLLHLLQVLDADWYVARVERNKRISAIQQISANKKAQQHSI